MIAAEREQGHRRSATGLCPGIPRPAAQRASARHLHQFFEARCDATPAAPALVCGAERLSYRNLDARANRLAHHLMALGVGPGDRVGLLLERSVHTYAALLAVLKTGAAFVPIDPSFPDERIALIAGDAAVNLMITTEKFRAVTSGLACRRLELDGCGAALATLPNSRPRVSLDDEGLCYIMYTSGSTGRPKGVAITQSNICNFLTVVAPIYGVTAADRAYQGLSIAFDFSIEEIWPTWMGGATLIAGPTDWRRIGAGLADFLHEHQVTVLCGVPTLLATLDRDLPSLRTLILGGEPCPRDLVLRWTRPGRRLLNTYGPTETTVTATWTELRPDQPVTIGRPLPGYTVHLLDDHLQPVALGEIGEICIGGIGVARGYVNRPDETQAKFVRDPFARAASEARLYRSGDLGRLTSGGEIEYLGRLDSQVKIRGYRIELSEIEAVLREDAAVESAIVSTLASGGAVQDLVAYVTLREPGAADPDARERLYAVLRRRLPDYMVPAFLEILEAIPTLASGKADRSRLPSPTTPRLSARAASHVAPATPLEAELAAVWGQVLGRADISVESDFFLDLGGHSLFAALVVSTLRRVPAFRGLGIADLYANPTIRGLASRIEASRVEDLSVSSPERAPLHRHRSARVWSCGVAQLALIYLVFLILGAPVAWQLRHVGEQRSPTVLAGGAALVLVIWMILSLSLPVAGARLLRATLQPGRYPLWGLHYLCWWLARGLLGLAPLSLLASSPLIAPYLRLLGARIGKACYIGTPNLGLPTLITIESGASLGYGVRLQPFVVENGWLTLAPIRIGADAFVGANAVVMAGASIGRNGRLAEQSLASCGETIPDDTCWAGSPAAPGVGGDPVLDALARRQDPAHRWSTAHLAGFVVGLVALYLLPFVAAAPGLLMIAWGARTGGALGGVAACVVAGPLFVLTVCTLVAIGKRVVLPTCHGGVYPLRSAFGLRKWFTDKLLVQSLALTNTLYATLYALPWLRLLGVRVGRGAEVSTVAHIDPTLLVLGPESFVADFATIGAATYHRGFVALGPTELGRRCFVGNAALIPSHTRLGDNSLIGVQSVPPPRPVEPGTSWLGSPAIFLPRRQTNEVFGEEVTYRPRTRLIVCRWAIEFLRVTGPTTLFYVMVVSLAGLVGLRLASRLPLSALVAGLPALALTGAVGVTLVVAVMKWLVVGRYRPRVEPLWSHFVRRTELITGFYESAAVPALIGSLTATPWIGPALRLFGARIGRRVWLDTTYLTEFDLVRVGDDAAIGSQSSLQTHLFEDRVMKMSTVTIGSGCSIGPRTVVLYDAEVGASTSVGPLSLVMKSETLPPRSRWRGIPARAME